MTSSIIEKKIDKFKIFRVDVAVVVVVVALVSKTFSSILSG